MTNLTKAVIQSEAIQHGLVQLSNLHFGRNIFFFMDIEAWNSDTWQVEFYIEDAQNNLDESREDQIFLAGMQQVCEVFGCKLLSDGPDEEGDHVPGFRGCQKFKFTTKSRIEVVDQFLQDTGSISGHDPYHGCIPKGSNWTIKVGDGEPSTPNP